MKALRIGWIAFCLAWAVWWFFLGGMFWPLWNYMACVFSIMAIMVPVGVPESATWVYICPACDRNDHASCTGTCDCQRNGHKG